MKRISFKRIMLLMVAFAITSAFATSKGKMAVPATGWYQTLDAILAPDVPAMQTDPLNNPTYDAARFEGSATAHYDIMCGSTSVKVCAAYFRYDDVNIQSPVMEGGIYFMAGGRP